MQVKSWRLPNWMLDTLHRLFLQFRSPAIRNESEFLRDKIIPKGIEAAQRELEAEARKRPRPGRSTRYEATVSVAMAGSFRRYGTLGITPSIAG
jgi:hypothetical protein